MNNALPTRQQYERLRSLGAHDAELTLMTHQHFTAEHVAGLIAELVRYPIGTGALRHWRLFGEYPRGARNLMALPIGERDTITAWRHITRATDLVTAAFDDGAYDRLDHAARLVDEVAELARNGHADASGNGAIVDRIDALALTLAGRITRARQSGALDARTHDRHARALPEQVRRCAREWRALAARQRERAARVRAFRMASAFKREPAPSAWRSL